MKNSFNDLKQYLRLMVLTQVFILIASWRQIFVETFDSVPIVAGVSTAALIATIIHLLRNEKK